MTSRSLKKIEVVQLSPAKTTGKFGDACLMLNPFSSLNRFHNTDDEVYIKSEPIESQDWEQITYTMENRESANVAHFQTPDESPILNGQKTFPEPVTPPNSNTFNISQRKQKSHVTQTSQLVRNPMANRTNALPKIITAVPLTVDLFKINQSKKQSMTRPVVIRTTTETSPTSTVEPTDMNPSLNGTADQVETLESSFGNLSESESGPWIAPCDEWMNTNDKNKRVYPTGQYIQCGDDSPTPLLRQINVTPDLVIKKEPSLPNPQPLQDSDDSTTCDKDEVNLLAPSIKSQKRNTNPNNERSLDQPNKTEEIRTIACEEIRDKTQSPSSSIISESDYEGKEDDDSIDNARPGPSGLMLLQRSYISDSDEPEQQETIRPMSPGLRENGKQLTSPCNGETLYTLSSDNDKETTDVSAKSRKSEEKKTQRRKKTKLDHPAFDSDCESRESTATPIEIEANGDTSSTEVCSDDDDQNSDGTTTHKKTSHRPPKRRKKGKRKNEYSLTYAKDWRDQLEAARVVKEEARHTKITRAEQQVMVDFLCSFPNIEHLQPKGYKIWQKLLNQGRLPHRTAQSLQNHFTKCLLPRIQNFFRGMSEGHKKQFKSLQIPAR